MSGFQGQTNDSQRNKIQETLFKSIGNDSTRSRSIELAIRTENALFERCGQRNDGPYKTHSKALLRELKDGASGFELNRKLLTGEMPPEKWVQKQIPKKLPKFVSKDEQIKEEKKETSPPPPSSLSSSPSPSPSPSSPIPVSPSDSIPAAAPAQPKDGSAKTKTEESSYYFFKSTDPEQAKKYAPKKLDGPIEEKAIAPKKGLSKWNAGATWEEKDRSKWAKEHLTHLLSSISLPPLPEGEVVFKAWTVTADASIVFTRGKARAGYEISGKTDFEGMYKGEKVKGTMKFPKIDNTDVSDDDYEISLSLSLGGGSEAGKVVKGVVKKSEREIREAVHQFEKDLKDSV